MQGFISWFWFWLKLVSNGTRLSKKIAAPTDSRLTSFVHSSHSLAAKCLVHECDGSALLPAL